MHAYDVRRSLIYFKHIEFYYDIYLSNILYNIILI